MEQTGERNEKGENGGPAQALYRKRHGQAGGVWQDVRWGACSACARMRRLWYRSKGGEVPAGNRSNQEGVGARRIQTVLCML